MNYLLDTNVVSEWVKPRPNPGVVQWLDEIDEDRIYLSTVTLAELRHGVNRIAEGARRQRLDQWLRLDLRDRFENRILPIDAEVADAWGVVTAQRERQGRPITAMDAFIAAIATVHSLTLVTHNVSDFRPTLSSILDPWREA